LAFLIGSALEANLATHERQIIIDKRVWHKNPKIASHPLLDSPWQEATLNTIGFKANWREKAAKLRMLGLFLI
jgi:hypothetical protein